MHAKFYVDRFSGFSIPTSRFIVLYYAHINCRPYHSVTVTAENVNKNFKKN